VSAWRWLTLVLLLATAAHAQIVPEREVEIIQSLYESGKYADAAKRANESLAVSNFSEAQRVKLHELAGLSAFNLNDLKSAQAAFLQLLRINPDYILDPFAVPPPAIKVFDQVRKDNADALNLVRQQITIRLEHEKRAAAERTRLAAEQEERRRRAEFLANDITVRTVEKRSMILNFVPFGAGQFQQGRTGWGVALAVSEGLMAVLSVVSYFAIDALFEKVTFTFNDRLTSDPSGVVTVTVRQIPEARHTERDVWTGLKYGTGIAFYALWALGVGDAIWRHEDQVVTERKEPVSPTTRVPSARLRIFPTPGGLGAGVTIGF
jgi:tetratricopeptide (TPR) repeat protein